MSDKKSNKLIRRRKITIERPTSKRATTITPELTPSETVSKVVEESTVPQTVAALDELQSDYVKLAKRELDIKKIIVTAIETKLGDDKSKHAEIVEQIVASNFLGRLVKYMETLTKDVRATLGLPVELDDKKGIERMTVEELTVQEEEVKKEIRALKKIGELPNE